MVGAEHKVEYTMADIKTVVFSGSGNYSRAGDFCPFQVGRKVLVGK